MLKEWNEFRIATPGGRLSTRYPMGQPLTHIHHVAHLETSYRILKDEKIRAGLIFDKSILNRKRILVNWLSPNHWYYGSRYGNVSFTYNFNTLVKNKNYYWVEVIRYSPPACRILITSKVYDYLDEYDPKTETGPWRYVADEDTHYWNGDCCMEFMLEDDLLLSRCSNIGFVDHNKQACCVDHSTCQDKGLSSLKGSLYFFATLIGNGLPFYFHQFTQQVDGIIKAKGNLQDAIGLLLQSARRKNFSGRIRFSDANAEAQVLAAVTFLGNGQIEQYKLMLKEFRSYTDYEEKLIDVFVKTFQLADDRSLDL